MLLEGNDSGSKRKTWDDSDSILIFAYSGLHATVGRAANLLSPEISAQVLYQCEE